MEKVALITGISGQDGSYLAKLLLSKGYIVHGTTRQPATKLWRHDYLEINGQSTIHVGQLESKEFVYQLLSQIQPTEIYHLAANSSVSATFNQPADTLSSVTESTNNLLKTTADLLPKSKFFFASSAEIFAPTPDGIFGSKHTFGPITPYGAAKAIGHTLTQSYRKYANIFAVNGILFQHESPLRDERSFIQKAIKQALAIKAGSDEQIIVGNIDNTRDFGSAEEFVEAIWKSLQINEADDHIIATGRPTTIREVLYFIVDTIGVDRAMIVSDPTKFPPHPAQIIGDPTETTAKLDWSATNSFFETIKDMIKFELSPTNKTYEKN